MILFIIESIFSCESAIANPMPLLPETMAVLIPITLPERSSSGPPLFPGLIAASVWISPERLSPFASMLLFFPLTIPRETEF